ncbi:MAG: cobyric acid synthase [Candidatus Nitrohelix vancouverensis]|uniref:Cobyric acid synthase n=1 Tax=Candidatus Nitrohelix vancouverensis TaxID=2705534 RepID=A0A7T0C339_9BACT|nr:MAG: cobyric acid synthase [Candidatus Nitrohelix vancouverensis]
MKAKTLMIQGTGSSVGKSVVSAALCRLFRDAGYKVAPFKAQNMSLNSFVTEDGGEISRAQAFQAEACGIKPRVEMNPLLLKPIANDLSQVVLMGKAQGNRKAGDYFARHELHRKAVKQALDVMRDEYDLLIIEGAGSPAEINLKQWDLVNMNLAKQAEAPVVIVADIDRGGSFAWMKGTLDLLEPDEQRHVAGFLVNKFRGDIKILEPGLRQFEALVGKPILGTLPYNRDLIVDEEDSLAQWSHPANHFSGDPLDIAVLWFPHIANFTDLAPLAYDPGVSLRYVAHPSQLGRPDLIIIPGSKSTIDDLNYMKQAGMESALKKALDAGALMMGICGGFQMLGKIIRDPEHIESKLDSIEGLGYFNAETIMKPEKITRQTHRTALPSSIFANSQKVVGYEIHCGVSEFSAPFHLMFEGFEGEDPAALGIYNDAGTIFGTYLHGVFDSDPLRQAFLAHVRNQRGLRNEEEPFSYQAFRDLQMHKLKDWIASSICIDDFVRIIEKGL